MSPHSDPLSWFRANQSLLFLLSSVCLAEKLQIQILESLVWPDRGSNPQSAALEESTLTNTPPMRFYCLWPRNKDILGLISGEVENHEIWYPQGKDLNRICLKFNDLEYFMVFDYFSHPFLPCQCLFTFCKYNITSLWPTSKKGSSEMWVK